MRKQIVFILFCLNFLIYIIWNQGIAHAQGYPPSYVNNPPSSWQQRGPVLNHQTLIQNGQSPWQYGGSLEERRPFGTAMMFTPGAPVPSYQPIQSSYPQQQSVAPQEQQMQTTLQTQASAGQPYREDHPVYHAQLIPMRKESATSGPVEFNYYLNEGKNRASANTQATEETPQERYQKVLAQKARERGGLEPARSNPQTESTEPLSALGHQQSAQAQQSREQGAEESTFLQAQLTDRAEGQIQKLQQKVKALEIERDGLKSFVQTLMQRVEKAQEIEKQWTDLIREKDELREMFNAMEEEVKQARQAQYQVEQLEAERDQVKAALEQLEVSLSQSSGAQKRIKQLEDERDQMKAILGSLDRGENSTALLLGKIKELETERNQLRAALDEKQKMEISSMTRGVQERMQELEAENTQLKQTVAQLTRNVEELTRSRASGLELGKLASASNTDNINLEQAKEMEHAEIALRQARVLAEQAHATMTKNQSLGSSISQRTEALINESTTIVKRVIIKSVVGDELKIAKESKDSVIVQVPELPTQAIEIVRGAAQKIVGRALTVDDAQRLGKVIGSALRENGLAGYDVVLPKQDISCGTVLVEVRRGS